MAKAMTPYLAKIRDSTVASLHVLDHAFSRINSSHKNSNLCHECVDKLKSSMVSILVNVRVLLFGFIGSIPGAQVDLLSIRSPLYNNPQGWNSYVCDLKKRCR